MRNLKSHVAIVTGGASGIGKAIAQRLVADEATVVITDVQARIGVEVAAQLGCTFLQQDVADEVRWQEVVRSVEEQHGALNILVNNAGIVGSLDAANPETTTLASWKSVFSINVEGVFLGCRTAIPAMRRAGSGAIVNLSSVAGLMATPYATAYGASKAAVRQLTKSVAQHCAEQRLNIRCNSLHPGIVRTKLWNEQIEAAARVRGVALETLLEEERALIPLGEFTHAEDVAAAVAFLVSSDARHITGEKLIVDGGVLHCDTYHLRTGKESARECE